MVEYQEVICKYIFEESQKPEYKIGTFKFIEKYSNLTTKEEVYYLNGKRHREDGPSRVRYYENGNIESEYYYLNMSYHRENGPAIIYYDQNGKIKQCWYFLNDIHLSIKGYYKQLKLKLYW